MSYCRNPRTVAVLVLAVLAFCPTGGAALTVGDTAPNFTLPEWSTRQPVDLYDFSGQIVLLDFFVYWCPHCQASSPDVEANIQDYYESRGGNPSQIPVQVLSISVEPSNPSQTDSFIRNYGLDLALDDGGRSVYTPYSKGGVPLFVLINGVAGANRDQWEILYHGAGYPGYPVLRSLIDSVVPEPASVMLLGIGAMALLRRRRPAR
jgi:peroxiredoxin